MSHSVQQRWGLAFVRRLHDVTGGVTRAAVDAVTIGNQLGLDSVTTRRLVEILVDRGVIIRIADGDMVFLCAMPLNEVETCLAESWGQEPRLDSLDGFDANQHGVPSDDGDLSVPGHPPDDDGHAHTAEPERARRFQVGDPASIFISYSHADQPLARALHDGLKERGQAVWIDEQELRIGDSLIERISTAIAEIDFFVALVSTAAAQSRWCQKELALAVSGELGREGMRVLPLRVDGAQMPAALGDQLYLDVSLDAIDTAVDRLLRDIVSYRVEPGRAAREARVAEQRRDLKSAASAPGMTDSDPAGVEHVRIVGVVEQGVGKPLNDVSRGSALYKVPLQLSRRPSRVWAELFKRNWDRPPRHTTLHRPGIASVQGDTIVLGRTTMEELENVHLVTLRAVMEKTNAEAAGAERREQEATQAEERQRFSHDETVRDVSQRLRFD